ncbi:MAG: ribonuclease Z [Dehalococcoidia bacterium]|nr:ribonuclease Z [Dehalococcoidia bacterium]
MELTFLGSGNAFASGGRYWSSFLIDRKYQFDAPPTLLPHLKKLGVPLPDLEVIFITHHHGDHFMGLPFLLLEYIYLTPRTKDLFIVGPPGVEAWTEDFAERCYPNITRDAGYRRRYVEARPGEEQKAGPLTFRAVPMNHVKESMEAFGYSVQVDGKTIAYTGDTMFCEEIFELAEGADILVADSTYSEGSGPEHMGLDDIRVIRQRLSPRTTMILTHLNGDPNTNGLENVVTASDLATFHFD